MKLEIKCSVEGCNKQMKVRTFCNKHYGGLQRFRANSCYDWERKKNEDEYRVEVEKWIQWHKEPLYTNQGMLQ